MFFHPKMYRKFPERYILLLSSKKRSRVNSYTNDKLAIQFSHEVMEAAQNVTYIINHIKSEKDYQEVIFSIYFKFKP